MIRENTVRLCDDCSTQARRPGAAETNRPCSAAISARAPQRFLAYSAAGTILEN